MSGSLSSPLHPPPPPSPSFPRPPPLSPPDTSRRGAPLLFLYFSASSLFLPSLSPSALFCSLRDFLSLFPTLYNNIPSSPFFNLFFSLSLCFSACMLQSRFVERNITAFNAFSLVPAWDVPLKLLNAEIHYIKRTCVSYSDISSVYSSTHVSTLCLVFKFCLPKFCLKRNIYLLHLKSNPSFLCFML